MTEEFGRPRLAVVGSHHVRRSVETHSIVACMDAPRETRHAWSCLLESARVARFTMLMENAANEPSGPLVNAIAYNTDYAKAREPECLRARGASKELRLHE